MAEVRTKLVELDRREIFTRLVFRPVIRLDAKGEKRDRVEARARRALEAARKYSLVANSVKSEIALEPEIVVADDRCDQSRANITSNVA